MRIPTPSLVVLAVWLSAAAPAFAGTESAIPAPAEASSTPVEAHVPSAADPVVIPELPVVVPTEAPSTEVPAETAAPSSVRSTPNPPASAPGHVLTVVGGAHRASVAPHRRGGPADPLVLDVPGAPQAFYYQPRGNAQRPVIMYLHGRGGNAQEDCRKWAQVAVQYGWVVCPQGPEDRGGGSRAWANSPDAAKAIMDATVTALRAKYRGKVQAANNMLIGFSEGAFIAQQVGLKDPAHWSRWLILAASDRYWTGDTIKDLSSARARLRRAYLLTGDSDGVAENTRATGELLKKARIPVRVQIVHGMGHEIAAERMIATYRRPLQWLATGH